MVSRENVIAWINALHTVYADNRQYLTDLDAAIGDADHGVNMDRGFSHIVREWDPTGIPDIGGIFKTTALLLIKTVGGAAGPLYGTFFLRASAVCAGKQALNAGDVIALLQAGVEGVMQRGKAQPNDKTMLDALIPALERMQQLFSQGAGLDVLLPAGAAAARKGMTDTIPLRARKGRASYLGDRSIGHPDPGATSACLMLEAMAESFSAH